VDLILESRLEQVSLIVEDNGVGFDEKCIFDVDDRRIGLIGMRERAMLVGGTLAVESNLGHGSTVVVRIPERAAS
jgi:signal transduction histidine kinase